MGYYEKREAKVNIAHKLMDMGWKVYGYYKDESDSMTDYYSPASWEGIATKNGFTLVIDKKQGAEERDITEYNPAGNLSFADREKIAKLEKMTIKNGATIGEESNAKELITVIKNKIMDEPERTVIGKFPGYMGNPGNSKWHIEKDGKIYDKGTGIEKFNKLLNPSQFDYATMEFKKGYEKWFDGTKKELTEEQKKAIVDFKALILKWESIINGCNGCHDGTEEGKKKATEQKENEGMEKIVVTEYKTEKKVKKIETPKEFKNGMYFVLNVNFNYNCSKNTVYIIENAEGRISSYRMNGKLTKKLTGYASANNRFNMSIDGFQKHIDKGNISFVEIIDEKTEIKKEKWVKKESTKVKTPTSKNDGVESIKTTVESFQDKKLNYIIVEDKDTRDGTKLWVLKVVEKLDKNEYIEVANQFRKIGGYYSKFKHGFLFKENPEEKLQKIA